MCSEQTNVSQDRVSYVSHTRVLSSSAKTKYEALVSLLRADANAGQNMNFGNMVSAEHRRIDVARKVDRKSRWRWWQIGTVIILASILGCLILYTHRTSWRCDPSEIQIIQSSDCPPDKSASHAPFFELDPETNLLLDLMLLRWQPAGLQPFNFSDPASRLSIQWPTNTTVVVPAVYNDFDKALPMWLFRWPAFVYQRKNPEKPLYCPNFGYEGGVYLQFIVDFYDNLPERTAFVQGDPNQHNDKWEDMLRCIKPGINFAPLATRITLTKTPSEVASGFDEPLLNCIHNTARAFHLGISRNARVKAYHNQMYMVSRDTIRQHTHVEYKRAYNIITARDDVCHIEGVEWDEGGDVIPMSNATKSPNSWISQGFTMELLFHWLVGGQPVEMDNDRPNIYCELCRPQSECPGGPCLETTK